MQVDYAFETHKLLKEKPITISAVVAAFNEEKTISNVLLTLISFPLFKEIIVVNDGSTDNTQKEIDKFINPKSNLKSIQIRPNKGKTNAILTGVKESSGELTCLFDADLKGLSFDDIYKMIFFVLNQEYDMTILDRGGDRSAIVGWSQSWIARFNGGERAFWKKEFVKIKFHEQSKYALEQIINLHYVSKELKVRTIYCKNLSASLQTEKRGTLDGLKVYRKMFKELYQTSKIKGFYIQIEHIVEDRLEPLYKFMNKSNKKVIKKTSLFMIIAAGLLTSTATFLWLNGTKNFKKISQLKNKVKKKNEQN